MQLTEEIPSKFYFEKWSSIPDNYDAYKLYCFNSKFNYYLRKIKDSWSNLFIPKPYLGKIHFFISISDGGVFVPMDEDLKNDLLPLVEKSYENEDYFMLFSCDDPVIRNNIEYPKSWVYSVIKEIPLPKNYDIIHSGREIYCTSEGNYVEFNNNINIYIVEALGKLWENSVICLDSEKDKEFIKKWLLVEYKTKHSNKLYCPTWINLILTKDRIRFLTERYTSNTVIVNIRGNIITFTADSYFDCEKQLSRYY